MLKNSTEYRYAKYDFEMTFFEAFKQGQKSQTNIKTWAIPSTFLAFLALCKGHSEEGILLHKAAKRYFRDSILSKNLEFFHLAPTHFARSHHLPI